MASTIRDKVNRLMDLYPPERMEGLNRRVEAFWNSTETRQAEVLFTMRRRDVAVGLNHNAHEMDSFTPEQALNMQLDDRLAKAGLKDLYIPTIISGNSPYYLSIALGCKFEKMEEGALVSFPLFDTAEGIDTLRVPDFSRMPDSPFKSCIERMDYFVNATEGKLPLGLPDPQGPMSLAAQLWNQEELFVSMMLEPESVHRMMDFCTQATVSYYHYLFERFGRERFVTVHCSPYLYRRGGLCLSEDMIGVLSPAQLEEFLLPYLNRIGEEFGPLVVHSCGNCRKKFGFVKSIKPLAGVHFGQTDVSDMPPEDVRGVRLLSPADWSSRKEILKLARFLKENKLSGWIQIHTIAGEIDQEEKGVAIETWAEIVKMLQEATETL